MAVDQLTSGPGSMRSAAPAWIFLGGGAAAMEGYVTMPAVALLLVLIVPILSIAAVLIGARRNEIASRRRPWYALAAGLAAFLGGGVLRAVVPGAHASPPGPAALIPDVLIVPGYVLFGYGLLAMLRRRRGHHDRLARADAFLIGIAAGLAAWSLLLAPRIGAGVPSLPELAAAAFPLVDVVLLVLVMRLMVADGVRQPALWLLMTTMALMFTVDTIYALYEVGASPELMAVFDLALIAGNVTLGAAALHPTMRTLCEPQQVITRSIGLPRIVGIAAVVVAPTLTAYLIPAPTLWDKLVRVGLAALLAVTVITRIVRSQASQAQAEEAARHRSTHDALTELPNRELLTSTITQWCDRAVDEAQEISLLFLDLDRFKQVNDSFGHRVGDELLCAVAGRLAAMVRSEDLVCRVGGDEFVIALASPSHTALAKSLAERLVTEFATPFHLSVGDVVVTPSIGVVRTSGAAEALELIRDADIAMYQAKDAGGNTSALFDESLRDRARTRVALEQALRGALGRGELSVNYQPIVRAADGELSGFEALMRWNSPELGFVSPEAFIPVAEMTGLIVDSGAWLLDQALDQLAVWHRDRSPDLPLLHMSVNISTRQLQDQSLVDVVRRALDRTGLPASALWLEITKSVMSKNPDTTLTVLNQLRDLGVTLCIDDFGTGYASLSYVRNLPASITKIDKSFIRGIGRNTGDEAIVLAVLAMAHAVGQQVVAEGVETVAQRDWLAAHGCDLIQGWLYGQPRPAVAQDAWIQRTLPPLIPAAAVG